MKVIIVVCIKIMALQKTQNLITLRPASIIERIEP